ncbi:unnamed protein product [Euphydryas editha]|uniref:THAP-type domain-containing protein n=1 Tax=Euphydryas editha TaxID=104508 RepID=A0AAU9TU26_EUPED|nr:unnamed protein product [Euphydryas editha]
MLSKKYPYRTYRCCIVPQCKNTTVTTPNKLFFCVPIGDQKRRDWCTAIGRIKPLQPNTNWFCCEDHFDIECDMENYMRWKLFGVGKLILKKGVLPHKFACQNYVSTGKVQKIQSVNSSLHTKVEIDSNDRVLSYNSDTPTCDNYVEAQCREKDDINNIENGNVNEALSELEQTDNRDPLAVEDTTKETQDTPEKPYIVNMISVVKLGKSAVCNKVISY